MGKMASNTPRTPMWLCGFAWPAPGVQASADVRGSEALGPCASSLRGSCSLTQVTFSPSHSPLFLPSPPTQPCWVSVWVVREGGVSHRLRAALTPDTLPHVLCPLPTHPRHCSWGWPCCPVGDLCRVFLWSGCSGWGVRLSTSPAPCTQQRAVSARRKGHSFSSLHKLALWASSSPSNEE